MKIKFSTVLKVIGMVGVPVTAFFAAKNQPDAEAALNSQKIATGGPLETIDVIKIEAKAHWMTILSAIVTMGAQAGSYSLDARTIAGLVGVISAGGYAAKEYREQLKKIVGKEKYEEIERKIKDAVSLDKLKNDPPKIDDPKIQALESTIKSDNSRRLYYDALSESWFIATPDVVLKAILDMNETIVKNGEYYVKKWVESLGIQGPSRLHAQDFGWTYDYILEDWGCETGWVDVYQADQTLNDGTPYTALYIYPDPVDVKVYEDEVYREKSK